MSDYLKQVEAAIRATVFHSPTVYSWFGKRSPDLSVKVKRALTPQTARGYLLFNLQRQLYNDFYCHGSAVPTGQEEEASLPLAGRASFVEALSAANSGSGYWSGGWEVRAAGESEVLVRRDGLEVSAQAKECLAPRGGLIVAGTRVSLRFPKEFLGISPGFYMALSDKELTRESTQILVRLYWNLTAEGAVYFMRQATSMLNRAQLPFKLKILNDPARFTRCDAGVLYIRKSDYDAVSEILELIYPNITLYLRQATPAFTKPIAPGVGLGEDPGRGESFGLHRCGLVAEGMIRAYEQNSTSIDQRLQAVVDRFAEDGLKLDEPFLNLGSHGYHQLRPPHGPFLQNSAGAGSGLSTGLSEGVFLETAVEIGRRLSHEAVWYGGRCNWLGALPAAQGATSGRGGAATYSALGPELYSGTSGVALFLAELYAATGDVMVHRTALGAIRQALWRVKALSPSYRLGLYTGRIGVAFVAARLGNILEEDELLELSTRLLGCCMRESQDEHEFDLLSGNAGAIAALVVLRGILDDPSLLDFAVSLGDELLRAADKSGTEYSWRSTASPRQRNLTGFSHGTAGVGYAFLELFRATRDSKYRQAAEMAFSYERRWFDASVGNWPDFREGMGKGTGDKHTLSFAPYWCHGAPGIALSRLRAYEILNDPTCKAEADIALETTRTMIETTLRSGYGNFSLCHGLGGNAEVLRYGSQILRCEEADRPELALEVAEFGLNAYVKRGLPWPCGIHSGQTPSLMLGLAGIGYFYLRLHEPATPSVLVLRPEDFPDQIPPTK